MFGTMHSFDWCTLSDWLLQVLKHMRRLVKCGNQLSFFSLLGITIKPKDAGLGPQVPYPGSITYFLTVFTAFTCVRGTARGTMGGTNDSMAGTHRLYNPWDSKICSSTFRPCQLSSSFSMTRKIFCLKPRGRSVKKLSFFTKSLGNGPVLSFSSGSELALAA